MVTDELREIIRPSYDPCSSLAGACQALRWVPREGYIPRGYAGGSGSLKDIELVLVFAEPGPPGGDEKYIFDRVDDIILKVSKNVREGIFNNNNNNPFHQNIKNILGMCFPDDNEEGYFRKAWLTESVLCSAVSALAQVESEKECVLRYLKKQKEMLSHAYWVALGKKAERRLRIITNDFDVTSSPARPEGYKPRAKKSFEEMATRFLEWKKARG